MTEEMFETITEWQDKVFTTATGLTAAHHLKEEVGELIHDLEEAGNPEMEYADCFLLLFGSAHKQGYTYQQILEMISKKFEIIQQRVWGKPNDKGYVKHVKE